MKELKVNQFTSEMTVDQAKTLLLVLLEDLKRDYTEEQLDVIAMVGRDLLTHISKHEK